jgi:hypothetical protein
MMCKPFLRFKYKIHARYFVLPILIFAPLYSVPRFFEIRYFSNSTYICTPNSTYWFQAQNDNSEFSLNNINVSNNYINNTNSMKRYNKD